MTTELQQIPTGATPRAHEHGWATQSSHVTSVGTVSYVSCVVCGARRVDVVEHASAAPRPLSAVIGGVSGR
ncbi:MULTISPECIES: hypothetical protein [unclassified Microbacterium]|uniref:hypothetical protein n=1 Tax=unclassified Microbacterium TaxID=2609290 RepID=UPI000B35362C|nr:hypothetical protein [Microbacterium sp. JB110]RCS62979.1 hypothetical protein CIK77_01895 [Microbacterium sp. JB110]